MRYKIWDKLNGWYLDLNEYCVNGHGLVMTTKGEILPNQDTYEVEIEEEK